MRKTPKKPGWARRCPPVPASTPSSSPAPWCTSPASANAAATPRETHRASAADYPTAACHCLLAPHTTCPIAAESSTASALLLLLAATPPPPPPTGASQFFPASFPAVDRVDRRAASAAPPPAAASCPADAACFLMRVMGTSPMLGEVRDTARHGADRAPPPAWTAPARGHLGKGTLVIEACHVSLSQFSNSGEVAARRDSAGRRADAGRDAGRWALKVTPEEHIWEGAGSRRDKGRNLGRLGLYLCRPRAQRPATCRSLTPTLGRLCPRLCPSRVCPAAGRTRASTCCTASPTATRSSRSPTSHRRLAKVPAPAPALVPPARPMLICSCAPKRPSPR